MDGQRFLKAFPETVRGPRVTIRKILQQKLQRRLGLGVIKLAVRHCQGDGDPCLFRIRQVREHIALLVNLAALNDGALAKHVRHRLVKRLPAIQDVQSRLGGIKTPLDQIGQQCFHDFAVLRTAFDQA